MFPPKSLSIQRFRKSKIYQLRDCPGQCLGIFRLARSRTNGPSNGALKISKVFLACLDFNGSIVIWANSDYQKWCYMCMFLSNCQMTWWYKRCHANGWGCSVIVVSADAWLLHFSGNKKTGQHQQQSILERTYFQGYKVKAWFQLKHPP